MSLTTKVVWTIERNLNSRLTLDDLAASVGASKYHLAHAFGASTGRSVMTYIRERRLTNAAFALANGAPDILDLALDTGYGSHEAFSRAFKALFKVTPETIRKIGSTEELVMPKAMKEASLTIKLKHPKLIDGKAMLVIGLSERQSLETQQNIPGQWGRFMTLFADIPNKAAHIPIGISTNMDDDGNFDYMCGVEVSRIDGKPSGLAELRVPVQKYAVFVHDEHISKIGATYNAIWNKWLPENNRTPVNGACLERHMDTFNPMTGLGGVEIWVPIQ